jgi:hypothetical protein
MPMTAGRKRAFIAFGVPAGRGAVRWYGLDIPVGILQGAKRIRGTGGHSPPYYAVHLKMVGGLGELLDLGAPVRPVLAMSSSVGSVIPRAQPNEFGCGTHQIKIAGVLPLSPIRVILYPAGVYTISLCPPCLRARIRGSHLHISHLSLTRHSGLVYGGFCWRCDS